MDWNNYNTATSDYVRVNWAIATVLSSTIMAMAMLYIVTEWCLQSHLSTASMSDAARGLYLTRRFRWLTSPFRDAIHYAIEGVYAVQGWVNGTPIPGLLHLGPRPTFSGYPPSVELYLLDWDGDLYGKVVRVDFCARLREIRNFGSAEALVEQMKADVEAGRAVFASGGGACATRIL